MALVSVILRDESAGVPNYLPRARVLAIGRTTFLAGDAGARARGGLTRKLGAFKSVNV